MSTSVETKQLFRHNNSAHFRRWAKTKARRQERRKLRYMLKQGDWDVDPPRFNVYW